jgi:hypothetical protein
MVVGQKPVQVREFFVGHGRVGHNPGIYRNLLIPRQLSAAQMPLSFTGPVASGGQSRCRARIYQGFVTPFRATTDGRRPRGGLEADRGSSR